MCGSIFRRIYPTIRFIHTFNRDTQLCCSLRLSSTSAVLSSTVKLKPAFPGNVVDTDKIDDNLIRHLERTSLVDFESEEALMRLKESIQFAQTIFEVDTNGVEPMTSVLENIPLRLREDVAVESNRKDILLNASVTEEDYFVSPPGNIPLEQKTKAFTKSSTN